MLSEGGVQSAGVQLRPCLACELQAGAQASGLPPGGVNLCWSPRKDANDNFKDLGAFVGTNKHKCAKGEISC